MDFQLQGLKLRWRWFVRPGFTPGPTGKIVRSPGLLQQHTGRQFEVLCHKASRAPSIAGEDGLHDVLMLAVEVTLDFRERIREAAVALALGV